jgi:hypothetical protein
MRGCDDGRVPLFWVADVVVATNSLAVIVAVCASVFTSCPHPRRCYRQSRRQWCRQSFQRCLIIVVIVRSNESPRRRRRRQRCHATAMPAATTQWRSDDPERHHGIMAARSGLPNPRRKSARAAFLPFASRSLAGFCVDASASRPLESTSSPSLTLPSLALPSSSSPPLSTLRPSPALLNAQLQCGRPRIRRRRRRPSNDDALPPAPHRCTAAAAPTTLHSHSPAEGAIADILQTPHH